MEDDDDDDDDVDQRRPYRRRSQKTTTKKQKPTKKKINSWTDEVKFDQDSSPAQIDFTEWFGRYKHPEDYDDFFYRQTYHMLYTTVVDWADKWFANGINLEDYRDTAADISAWEVPMTDQFIQYARTVVHEDRPYITWKDILSDPTLRKWLCVSIFAQIIERKVFNQLLFGVPEQYEKELDRHDLHWSGEEGKMIYLIVHRAPPQTPLA